MNEPTSQPKPASTPPRNKERIEVYRVPVAQVYPDYASRGRARRLSFRGSWTKDGKYHDID